jgi:hypothetical protein
MISGDTYLSMRQQNKIPQSTGTSSFVGAGSESPASELRRNARWNRDAVWSTLLPIFIFSYYRSMPYTYVKDDELKGVPLKMFGIAPWAYQNSSVFPDNEGFKVNDRDSVPTGLMRVDPCRFGKNSNNLFLRVEKNVFINKN